MPPTNNQTPQGAPASLPSPQPTAAPQQPIPQHVQTKPEAAHEVPIGARAKLLVEQYKANPYQLAMALQQLKGQYLSDHFGITSKSDGA